MSPTVHITRPLPCPWFLGALLCLALGCGGGGGGGGGGAVAVPAPPAELASDIVYSKYRDPVTGTVEPVLTESGFGFDASEVDSPAIAVDPSRPGGDRFLLYYEATNGSGVSTIGVVSSDEEDLIPLAVGRTQAVGQGAMGSGYSAGATDPSVVVDHRSAENPTARYKMWFEGRSGASGEISSIIYCLSDDGVTWAGFTPCTGLGASFASVRVADPSVVLDGDTFRMWFEAVNSTDGSGDDGPGAIGYAESPNGIDWLVRDASGATGAAAGPVFVDGADGSFDDFGVSSPGVVLDDLFAPGAVGRFKMWYEAADSGVDTENTLGYAVSADGLSWNDPALPILRPSSDLVLPLPFDSGDLEHPSAAIDDGIPAGEVGHFILYYTGDGENGASPNRIGLALGREGP